MPRLKRWFAYTLTPWFAHSLVSRTAFGDCTGFIKPATHADVETAKYPESLCPQSVLPPMGRRDPPPPRTLLLVPRSYGLMRQTLPALPSFGFSPRSESLCRLLPAPAASGFLPSRPGEFHPEALTDSGREPLDSSGSCHRMKATAFRQDQRFLPFPVDLSIPTPVTCPRRSPGITLLPHYHGAVRPWLKHRYFRPHGSSACAFSLTIASQVLKFRTKSPN